MGVGGKYEKKLGKIQDFSCNFDCGCGKIVFDDGGFTEAVIIIYLQSS